MPYCQTHCPLHNNIPDWLKLTAEGRLREAYELSQATNTFPEICGRICPQDRLCEGNCVIEQAGHGTVTIGAVEKYITDTAWEEGWVQPPRPLVERPESVGIIGAGPGGLAAADMLRRQGVQVTVYDRHDRAGGLLTYGIPGFKLEKDVVMRRNAQLAEGGVTFVLDCNVGEDIAFDEIRARHDAVLIATGVYKSRDLGGPGAGLKAIVRAIDYLTASNRKGFGDEVPEFDSGELDADGKRVVVIGGGDTAMDCVRTAVRQGAAKVTCLYRRDRANMPGSQREVANAEEEGVEFAWLTAPRAFTGDAAVTGRAGDADAARGAGRHRAADAGGDPGRGLYRAGGAGHQGARLRAGGAAEALGRRGAGGDALGDGEGGLPDQADEPRGGLCRGRHRAGREPRGLGDPRRARGGGEHHGLARRPRGGGGGGGVAACTAHAQRMHNACTVHAAVPGHAREASGQCG